MLVVQEHHKKIMQESRDLSNVLVGKRVRLKTEPNNMGIIIRATWQGFCNGYECVVKFRYRSNEINRLARDYWEIPLASDLLVEIDDPQLMVIYGYESTTTPNCTALILEGKRSPVLETCYNNEYLYDDGFLCGNLIDLWEKDKEAQEIMSEAGLHIDDVEGCLCGDITKDALSNMLLGLQRVTPISQVIAMAKERVLTWKPA